LVICNFPFFIFHFYLRAHRQGSKGLQFTAAEGIVSEMDNKKWQMTNNVGSNRNGGSH